MISSTKASFRSRYRALPPEARSLARKTFKLWLRDPHYPSIRFKKVGRFWPARVGADYRALAIIEGNKATWFWIGRRDEYELVIAT